MNGLSQLATNYLQKKENEKAGELVLEKDPSHLGWCILLGLQRVCGAFCVLDSIGLIISGPTMNVSSSYSFLAASCRKSNFNS